MGYNWQLTHMKKILVLCLMILLSLGSFATNPPIERQENDAVVYIQIVEANSKYIDILVYANSIVDEFCDLLSRKDVSVSVGLYCAFMPENPMCWTYGVAMAACSVKGAVELYIEGDFNNAILETLSASTRVYKMSKVDSKKYKIE